MNGAWCRRIPHRRPHYSAAGVVEFPVDVDGAWFRGGRHLREIEFIQYFEGFFMKVAIAKEGDMVSEHFGHCTEYAVFVIEKSKITSREILESPGHEPGKLPPFLASHKVTHVLAGGMGPRAVDLFCENNIEVFLGVRGRDRYRDQGFHGRKHCTG